MDASDLPLPDLRAAIAVAALRHFGLAAKSIRLAQVTHAAHVQKVEPALGTALAEQAARRLLVIEQGDTNSGRSPRVWVSPHGCTRLRRS